jgi:hypothetical protein
LVVSVSTAVAVSKLQPVPESLADEEVSTNGMSESVNANVSRVDVNLFITEAP